jgi:hypothetical protein
LPRCSPGTASPENQSPRYRPDPNPAPESPAEPGATRHQKRGTELVGFDLFTVHSGGRLIVAAIRYLFINEQLRLAASSRM